MTQKHSVRYLKKTPFIAILSGTLFSFIVFLFVWEKTIAPQLLAIPKDFSYTADIVSYDDFYDAQAKEYKGPVLSNTAFSYRVIQVDAAALTIANKFDVRKPNGDQIFTVNREYGINPSTGEHIKGYGDKDRTGYLFAPRNSQRQDFQYWHVNYDTPAQMKFNSEETIAGVKTYVYQGNFTADQTNELTNLPEVGTTRGISVDVKLKLWIEPVSGHLIKYHDDSTAYYYDLTSKKRLYPWNHFTNTYKFASVAKQAKVATSLNQKAQFIEVTLPVIAGLGLMTFLILAALKRGIRARLATAVGAVSAALALGSLIFWYGFGLNLGLADALTPMYPGASAGITLLVITLLLMTRYASWVRPRRQLIGSLLLLGSVSYTLLAVGKAYGIITPETSVLGGFVPFILQTTAMCIAVFMFLLGSKLLVRKPSQLRHLREILAAYATGVAFASSLAYTYGENSELLIWLHDIRWPAAIALALIGMVIFSLERDWFITKQVRRLGKGGWLFAIVLLGLLALTGLSWQAARQTATRQTELQFQSDISSLQTSLSDHLRIYANVLYSARGLFEASDQVSREEWKAYINNLRLDVNYPGMLGMGYAQIIPQSQLAAHTSEIKKQGFPQYAIYPSEPARDLYTSIIYIEPFDSVNQKAFGYDMLSEPTRRAALEKARDTGEATMTNKVVLVQDADTSGQPGFLMYVPVFKKGASLATVEDRRKALIGYVYSPFRMNNFMQTIVGNQANGIDIEVFDASDQNSLATTQRIYTSSINLPLDSSFKNIQILTANNHSWTIRYVGSKDYGTSGNRSLPNTVIYAGVLLSFAIAAAIFGLVGSRQRAFLYAKNATADLVKERDQAIRLQQKDETILSGINEGLIAFDADGRIEKVNKAAQRLLGYSEDELLGKLYHVVLKANDAHGKPIPAGKRPATQALVHKKAILQTELEYTRKDGRIFSAELSVAPLLLDGKLLGAIEIFRDITDERSLDKAKSEFVSLASHQLRTPLSAIHWYTEMLLSGDFGKPNKVQREYLEEIHGGNKRMTALVNSLLDTSRLELGRIANTPQPTKPIEIIASVEKDFTPQLKKRKQIFVKEIAPKATSIFIDPKLLRMIIQNIVSNSIMYSPDRSTITVSVRPAKPTDFAASGLSGKPEDFLFLSVKDTGYGIPENQRDKVFQKLFRADNVRTLSTEGTGLGLYIVKQVTEKLGGKVWFESQESIGTTFSVLVPLKTTPSKLHDSPASSKEP